MRNDNQKVNIICLSNQLWDFPLWTNKKHVMSRLGKRGYKVIFVDPPINTGRLFFKQLLAKKWPLKRLLTGTTADEGIKIYSPLNFFPSNKLNTKSFIKKINTLANSEFDKNLKTVLWVYHVEIDHIEEYLDAVAHDVLVYDCVDNYPAFPKYDTQEKKQKIQDKENYLARNADIVFATAPGLEDKLSRVNPKTFYTPNVGDFTAFSQVPNLRNSIPDDLKNIPRPIIGFTGATDEYKFDKVLMKKISEDYPSYSFVIIGMSGLKDREASIKELGLEDKQNIYFLGSRDYKLMPNYYAGFDVFIIPYVLNDYTVGGCFPVKFHEGLAAGLPVVVTSLPAYREFSDVCYISKTHNDFSQNIRRALEEDSDKKQAERVKVAKENDWEGKIDRMLSLIKTEALEK